VCDARTGRRSFGLIDKGQLVFVLYLSPDPVLVSRQWAVGLLSAPVVHGGTLLAGRPGADTPDGGAIVCSCMAVGVNTIVASIADQGCTTVEAVGACTRAGTNCGSCRAEIRGIIDANYRAAAE
jgi:assimilatory nitrate reductase catalytic subunit